MSTYDQWENTWATTERHAVPPSFFQLLREQGIISEADIITKQPFVFLGIASGLGQYELSVASHLDEELKHQNIIYKPRIISTDRVEVVPPTVTYNHVKYEYRDMIEASNLAFLADGEVDVILDKMGAFFYADPVDEGKLLLREMDRVLKPGGKLVVSQISMHVFEQRNPAACERVSRYWSQRPIKKDYWDFVVLSR